MVIATNSKNNRAYDKLLGPVYGATVLREALMKRIKMIARMVGTNVSRADVTTLWKRLLIRYR